MTSVSEIDLSGIRVRPEVLRIPRMRRLAYLRALLDAIGQDGCTKEEARLAIIKVVRELDAGKAAALGRQPPKVPKAEALVEQCVQIATRLGLVERRHDHLTKTVTGAAVDTTSPNRTRALLFRLIWEVFPYFRMIVAAVCSTPEGFLLPVNRYGGLFTEAANQRGLTIDQMSFEVVRDLATELLLVNWRPMFQADGEHQYVYAIGASSIISRIGGTSGLPQGAEDPPQAGSSDFAVSCAAPISDTEIWTFTGNVVDIGQFESALWKRYLQLTDRVPRFPVLYPTLRDSVCEALRIADSCFDGLIQQLLRNPKRLEIYPAEGVLDYSAKTAITYKQVPPRTIAGQFMTYLKIDRRIAGSDS